jgi:hypothetical protein
MKKQLFLGSFLALTSIANSQIYTPSGVIQGSSGNNNVGIGINPPVWKLDIRTSLGNDGVNVTQTGSEAAALHLTNSFTGGRHWALFSTGSGNGQGAGNFSIYDYTGGVDRFFINQSSGNVGFGTNAPNACLDILQRSPQTAGIKFTSLTLGNPALEFVASGSPTNSRVKIFGDGKTYIGQFTSPVYNANGSVLTLGQSIVANKAISVINGTNPTAADVFAVYGDGTTEIRTSAVNAGVKVTQTGNTAAALRIGHTNSAEGNWALMAFGSGTGEGVGNFGIYDQNALAARLFVAGSGTNPSDVTAGNVGIGTNLPKSKLAVNGNVQIGANRAQGIHADYKLSVEGKIVAQSLYITAAGSPNWADYVFADDYKLQSLSEIETYYKANKHLPEIPTTKEVEEKGIDVAQMNVLLLKKIEELTIHMVEQQKQIDALKNR